MLELVFELLLYTLPQTTGHAVLYVLTFGQVKCADDTAAIIGCLFWLAVCGLIIVALR